MNGADESLLEHEDLIDPADFEQESAPTEADKKPAEGDKKPEDATAKELRQIRQELKRERESRVEAEKASQYWQGQLRGAERTPAPKQEEPEEDVDLVDLITKDGSKGFNRYMEKVLAKGGYVKKSEVEARIAQERSTIQYEASLLRQYPELENDDSPMFEQTKKEYAALIKDDPALAKSPATMRMAAKLAAAELKGTGKGRQTDDFDDEYEAPRRSRRDDDAEDEDDRVRRVSSQQGVRGRRPSAQREGSDELTGIQKSIIARIQEAGGNVTEESYKKRAAAGISMSGLPGRRGR